MATILKPVSAPSIDVIHALALPGIGLKLDAIPTRVFEQLISFLTCA
jgi:heme/copper-type cytochrome/quinol oxidase subunit 2